MVTPKLRKFRVYDSEGIPTVIESESVSFKKTKHGLTIKFKGQKTIKGAIGLTEIMEQVVAEVPKPVNEDDDDLV